MRQYFLESARIKFSTWSLLDFKLAKSLWSNEKVTRLIGGAYTDDKVKLRLKKEIKTQEKNSVQYWPIFSKDNNEFIGCCGLTPYSLEDGVYEIGFHLMDKFWGKGYGYEAAKTVIEYAKKQSFINGLFAGHNPSNNASKNLLLKLGFIYTHNEFYQPTGLQHPSYKYTFTQ